MSLGMDVDIEFQWSRVEREAGESDESVATRLYNIQYDVYQANVGTDISRRAFTQLSANEKEPWLKKAKQYK